jgi:hypothetical protein
VGVLRALSHPNVVRPLRADPQPDWHRFQSGGTVFRAPATKGSGVLRPRKPL